MGVTLGCIGAGNMGMALLRGILEKNALNANDLYIYDAEPSRMQQAADLFKAHAANDNRALVRSCDIVLLAVKPNVCRSVLEECGRELAGKAVISIVTGWTRADIEAVAPSCRVLRVMPNTPCLVGEGMAALDMDHTLTNEEFAFAKRMFDATGKAMEMPPELMNAVTGVSGSGPAYVYMFIEALADGGVREGLSREAAMKLAAQTVLGAAKMVLETGMHPGALKDAVCSPGGTTIEAVVALERGGMRAAVMDAVEVCTEKARMLSER